MCGIVGVIGAKDCEKVVFDGLKKLQYRGYDSAGICLQKQGEFFCFKAKGEICELEKRADQIDEASCAIGHTRWATHGKVSKTNAHPILSYDQKWAVVHNGIIENYSKLQDQLSQEGMIFKTETDTEVVAALLSLSNYESSLQNLIWACGKLKGSYALCVMKKGEEALYLAKNKSPLYVWSDGKSAITASDPICFPEGEYYRLEDGEFAKVEKEGIEFFNSREKIVKQPLFHKVLNEQVSKDGFEHFMLKEIYQTPQALFELCKNFEKADLSFLKKWWIGKVKLVGCGSAYHSCLLGAQYFKKLLSIDAEAVIASEFRYDHAVLDPATLCIFVSQSGETADTIAAAEKALKKTKKIVALTNVAHSSLASLAKRALPISAGPEIAVASTKAYTCQVAALYLLASALKGKLDSGIKKVKKVAKTIEKFYLNISRLAEEIAWQEKVFFIGRGSDYVTALEGALKLKEISYINCNAFAAGELKHGVLTLIEKDTPLIVLASDKRLYDKTLNSAFEAKARGAKLYLVSSVIPQLADFDKFECCLTLPDAPQDLVCFLETVVLQLLAYNVCIMRGNDPDKPRNLAKSVTVE